MSKKSELNSDHKTIGASLDLGTTVRRNGKFFSPFLVSMSNSSLNSSEKGLDINYVPW
jgi:hypothetical protein